MIKVDLYYVGQYMKFVGIVMLFMVASWCVMIEVFG